MEDKICSCCNCFIDSLMEQAYLINGEYVCSDCIAYRIADIKDQPIDYQI